MTTAAERLKARLLHHGTKSTNSGGTPPVVPQPTLATPHPGTDSLQSVQTDLQSATLVVVERPAEQLVSGGAEQQDVSTDLDTSNPVHQHFLQRLADLEAALLARDPLMKTHLGEIHKHMIQYEEIANLLRPEEIAKIMAAQQAHTGIVLRVETLSKSKASATKKANQLGLGDI